MTVTVVQGMVNVRFAEIRPCECAGLTLAVTAIKSVSVLTMALVVPAQLVAKREISKLKGKWQL